MASRTDHPGVVQPMDDNLMRVRSTLTAGGPKSGKLPKRARFGPAFSLFVE
jgi:hypothetical protein